ncbi:nitroreductase family protein [Thalassotalea montiporae]
MQPRRAVFALAYIGETVDCYVKCVAEPSICAQELKWATDVLTEYFDVVELTQQLKVYQEQFQMARATIKCDESSGFIPYAEHARPNTDIDASSLNELFKRRRSVRWYQDKPVAKELVYQAMEMAALAPSACNRQPFEFHLLTGDDAVSIAKLAMGTAGFAENIPALFVVIGDLSSYPAERDKHVIYIDASLASMQLMLAFESLGVSTCPINWPDIEFREKLMAKKLKLTPYQRPIMLMSFGYADAEGKIPFSQKKRPEQLIKEVQL